MAHAAEFDSKTAWDGGKSPFRVSYGKMFMWFFLISDALTFGGLLCAYGFARHAHADEWALAEKVFTHFPFVTTHVPLAYVGLMTFILIMSSVTMVLAVDAGHNMNRSKVLTWLGLTIIGGFMFLGSQAWEWYHFIEGSEKGSYILADGRFARTDDPEPGTLIFQDHSKVEGAEAEALMASAKKNSVGANLTENEYGNTPLFANFFFFITGFHGFHVFSGVVLNIIVFILVFQGFLDRKGDYELVEKVGLYWHFVDIVWIALFSAIYLIK